jgi:hypothetical protein
MIDHELIHKSVIDSGGVVVGGYMRAWVANDGPSDEGWNDLDVYGVEKDKTLALVEKIQDATGGRGVDFKYLGIVCNFYCNSWIYDGRSIYREKTKSGEMDDGEVLDQTRSKMAVLISENAFGVNATVGAIMKYMRKYNFTIHNPDKSLFDLKAIYNLWIDYFRNAKNTEQIYSEAEKKMVDFALKDIMPFSA